MSALFFDVFCQLVIAPDGQNLTKCHWNDFSKM